MMAQTLTLESGAGLGTIAERCGFCDFYSVAHLSVPPAPARALSGASIAEPTRMTSSPQWVGALPSAIGARN
ncbi:hypothetical protein H8B02_30525 [Bradyrhizobium sp. Pear77]|uniref:hypothetical protein n=1 Tax=Bradyrhizobium TaxID=374 RepID=UPI001E610A97|nr:MULTISPECIES: hypothetical protein [Bradyrhizobium]MCC8957612.1 hypothetical protein [Bradyrhizobium altum]MCC8968586.1 hypothetical protein [Bradyrhizobium oropedii]